MSYKIEIQNNFFVVTDTITGIEEIREVRDAVKWRVSGSLYSFFYNIPNLVDQNTPNIIRLGENAKEFDFSEIVDSTETPFASRAIFNALLNENLGFIIRETSSVWGLITGDINDQTDLQTVLNGKFDVPTGDATQYIAGDGTLITFPVAGQAGTLVRQVRNTTGATLTKGTIVYINGANGNKPTIAKALATSDATSAQTFGFLQSNISNNSNGFVVVIGDLAGLDTSAITEGTQLYLSSTVAGEYTTTKQVAPAHLVYVGIVTRSHPTQGQIEVKIQNGYELDELHDVLISGETDGQVLQFESASGLWKNKTLATGLTVGSTAIAGGVDGRVLFQNGGTVQESADLSFNNSTKTISSGNLFLNSGLNASKIELFSAFSGNTELTLQSSSGDAIINGLVHLNFRLNGTQQMKLYSSTNLMLGQNLADSGYKLHVAGNIYCSARGALSTDVALLVRNSANTADLFNVKGNGQAVLFNNSTNSSLSSMDSTNTFVAVSLENFSLVNTTFKKVLGIQSYAGSGIRYLTMSNVDDLHWSHRFTIAGRLTTSAGISSTSTSNDFNSSTIANLYGVNLISQASISMRPDFNLALTENNLGLFIAPNNTANPTKKLIKLMDSTLTTTYFTVNGSGQTAIGTDTPTARLHIVAQGALSTDIAFRVRNSANTADWFSVQGNNITNVVRLTASESITIAQPAGLYYPNLNFIANGSQNCGTFEGYNGGLYLKNATYFNIQPANVYIGAYNTGDASAVLTVNSTTKGFLPPRMTNAQRTAIATPAVGLMVYCTDTIEGLYIYKSTGWTFVI